MTLAILGVGCSPASTRTTTRAQPEQPASSDALSSSLTSESAATPASNSISSECARAVDSLPPPTPLAVDALQLVASDEIASLPVPGIPSSTVTSRRQLSDATDYLAISSVPDPTRRLRAFERDGFRGGVQVEYGSGSSSHGVIALRFRDQASAVDYMHEHLRDVCPIVVTFHALNGLAGIAYLRSDGLARAVFVLGDTEISLCNCVGLGGEQKLDIVTTWAHAVAAQLANPT